MLLYASFTLALRYSVKLAFSQFAKVREENTRMQKMSKENPNVRDLGTKCRENAEKREITG